MPVKQGCDGGVPEEPLRRGCGFVEDIPLSGQAEPYATGEGSGYQCTSYQRAVGRQHRCDVLRRDHPVLRGRQRRRPAQDGLLKGGQAQKTSNHTWASGEPERLPAGLLHPRGEQIRGTHHDAGHRGVRPQV